MRVLIIVSLLLIIFWSLRYLLSQRQRIFENLLVFECGYESFNIVINKMSCHYYKIIIIFIIFDLELIFLIIILKNKICFRCLRVLCYIILLRLVLEFFIKSLFWEF